MANSLHEYGFLDSTNGFISDFLEIDGSKEAIRNAFTGVLQL
jgi:hypothetical protein